MNFQIISIILAIALLAPVSGEASIYKIDLEFLKDGSVLQNGTSAESDAYNSDSANQRAHPVFTEKAELDFGTRVVHVYLIASRHDGDADVRYVEAEWRRLNLNPQTATLFVEQGDPLSIDGSKTILTSEIEKSAPELLPALARAQKNPRSILSPEFIRKMTFAQVARAWQSAGGRAVNIDLAQNFQPRAVEFLTSQMEKNAAARFLRIELDNETFFFSEIQKLMKLVYSPPFVPQEVDGLKDCCGNARDWTDTFLADNQLRDLTRERYMRKILAAEIQDGDVILTHPVHMRHLLSPEQRTAAQGYFPNASPRSGFTPVSVSYFPAVQTPTSFTIPDFAGL